MTVNIASGNAVVGIQLGGEPAADHFPTLAASLGRLLAEVRAVLADEWEDCRYALERVESELSETLARMAEADR